LGTIEPGMATFAHVLAPLMLLLPALGMVETPRDQPVQTQDHQPANAEQVSIQQRVTIRVSPRSAPMPFNPMMFDNGLDSGRGPRFIERKMGDCLPIAAIAGVQAIDNSRLLLILNDRRMVTAKLEKGCQGREFYSGFIVARNADAQICVGRDRLQSRSGTACQVSGFRQLIQISD
jgi:hypothetical protein